MNIVQLEANDDPITARVHASRRKALATIDRIKHSLSQLFGTSATVEELQSASYSVLGKLDLFSGMGHGDDTQFTGHGQIVVLSTDLVRSATESAIVHLYSCNTANQLGPYLVAEGKAKAYIGYKSLVGVGRTASLSDIFVEEAAAIDLAISFGQNYKQTKAAGDAAYNIAHRKLEASNETTPRDLAIFELNHDNMVGPWSDLTKFGSF